MSRSEPARRPAVRRRARPTYHHGDLRAVVLDQVRRIIRDRGVGFVSIREVARRARVSHGAPAHHFGNKAGLLTAFAAQGYDRLADAIAERLRTCAADPASRIAAMGQGYILFAVTHPEHFGIMFPGTLLQLDDPDYVRATDRVYKPFMEIIAAAAADGALGADAALVGTAAWSLAHGVASLWMSGRIQARTGARDVDAVATATTELFVSAVMRRPAARPATGRRR